MSMPMVENIRNRMSKLYAPAIQTRLERFASKEQVVIAAWLIKNPVGTNYALQVLEYLEDLSKKENIRPAILLQELLKDFNEDELHPKELGRRLRDCLYERIHPRSEQHRMRFESFQKRLQLPHKAKVIPPQNFEGTDFRLEIPFQNVEDLKQKLQQVQESIRKKLWQGIEEF